MRRCLQGLVMLALVVTLMATATLPAEGEPADSGTDRYIVVLKDEADVGGATMRLSQSLGLEVGHVYDEAFRGYSAKIRNDRIDDLLADPQVSYVERDQQMSDNGQSLPWGVNASQADKSSTKAGNGSGTVSGVNTYVIDSGVTKHPDLNVVKWVNFTEEKNVDCHGHGTHVSGTIAARDNKSDVVGVAPGAPITSLKVLDCESHGWYSDMIAAINWITKNAKKPAVANMSIGGNPSDAVDDAIRKSAASGVLYTLSAGNKKTNACNQTPARAGAGTNNGIVTVAALDLKNLEADFSNYGKCVDLWAPGVNIRSTGNEGGTRTMSGTSMAAPHVAGAGALYLSRHRTTKPADAEAALKKAAWTSGHDSKDGAAIRQLDTTRF